MRKNLTLSAFLILSVLIKSEIAFSSSGNAQIKKDNSSKAGEVTKSGVLISKDCKTWSPSKDYDQAPQVFQKQSSTNISLITRKTKMIISESEDDILLLKVLNDSIIGFVGQNKPIYRPVKAGTFKEGNAGTMQAMEEFGSEVDDTWSIGVEANGKVRLLRNLLPIQNKDVPEALKPYDWLVCKAKEKCQLFPKAIEDLKLLVKNSPEHQALLKRGLFQNTQIEILKKMCAEFTSDEFKKNLLEDAKKIQTSCEKSRASEKAQKIDFKPLCHQLVNDLVPILKEYSL